MAFPNKLKCKNEWVDLSLDFGPLDTNGTLVKKNNRRKLKKEAVNIDDEFFDIPVHKKAKKEQSNSLSKLLEACDPAQQSDLAVSRQKQNEISDWLYNHGLQTVPKILVLSGPSGCGKTAALKLLAKENGFNIIEWITPTDSGLTEHYSLSNQADKFSEFLIRATRYNSVLQDSQSSRRLLLVKDIPNVYFINKEAFHDLLSQYLELGREPLVFVCSDSEGSKVQYSLFPPEVVTTFGIDRINLHATTQVAMKNMLKRVTPILNSIASHMLEVTQDSIDEVLSNAIGDVRSTLLNIIFTSLKVPNNKLKSDCGLRGESLGLLHGVGRVIYPKRVPDGQSWKFSHDPDDIAGYFESQSKTFLHFLHENYLHTMDKIESVAACSDIMSLSDTITTEWRDSNLIKVNLSLCIRGVMVCNENPMTKWNPVRKPNSEESKLQRDLGVAEEHWYKSIIRPTSLKDLPNLENTIETFDDEPNLLLIVTHYILCLPTKYYLGDVNKYILSIWGAGVYENISSISVTSLRMIESPGWGASRDEEIHKAAANVQLRKYGQLFNWLSETWWEDSSSLGYIMEGPIRLVYQINDNERILSLVEMENKSLSKLLATVAATCKEIRLLKREAPQFYTKLLTHGEKTELAHEKFNFNKLLVDLQDLSVYVNRISSVISLTMHQLSSLTGSSYEIYLPALIEHFIDCFIILVTLDELIDSFPTIVDQWKKYRINIRSIMHNPSKFSIDESKLMTFDKLLKDLHTQLLMKNLLLKAIDQIMEIKKGPVTNDHLLSYLRNSMTEIENKMTNVSSVNRIWVRTNVGLVISTKLFGSCDKKLMKRLQEVNKKLYGITLVGNVVLVPNKFLYECIPADTGTLISLQVGERVLASRIQKLPIVSNGLINKAMLWCIEAQNLLSGTDFQISDIKKQYSLLKEIVSLLGQIAEVISFVTNVHATLYKPMTRSTVQIICRMIEVQKNMETTLHTLGPMIVQAQGRALQCLSYEILVILEAVRKGLVQKDHAYSRERLDALSLTSLSMKLINGPATADRRLIVRCALSCARQLADAIRDEEALKLKQKLDDYDIIAELDTTVSETCDYSVLLHHQSMIPAYFSSVAESTHDISHVVHLLNAFNSAVVRQGPSEFTDTRVAEMKDAMIKSILEPACREIETSLRLHVHAHLKLDIPNPFKDGTKDAGRVVRALPLPISGNLVSAKRFVEHYLDDIFYNLTTVALHDWKTYKTMHALAKYKLGLDTVQNHLPTQTLEQGLDALEIMRNIHVFVSKYLYNLNTQTFIEHTSANKHLNTIGIRHTANSIRTHGTGIMSTTVNFVYQFLRVKLHTFSQFLFDEHIKSRLLRDIRFIKSQRERDETPYTYERAEKFQKGIRKLGVSVGGLSYLDQFRQLITQIGNALGYVRLIRSGGLHACANAVSFLPGIDTAVNFEDTCKTLNHSESTQAAAKRLDDDIGNLVRNFTEGIQYFKLLVDVFASAFRDPKSHHLHQFYAIVPPLTLSFIDNAVSNKEKIFKKNKDGAAFTDDGFAMGIAYINALMDQSAELDGLQWFETVDEYLRREKMLAEKIDGDDEKLQQTRALTLKRLVDRTAEFQLLYYSLSGARVFFKQSDH